MYWRPPVIEVREFPSNFAMDRREHLIDEVSHVDVTDRRNIFVSETRAQSGAMLTMTCILQARGVPSLLPRWSLS